MCKVLMGQLTLGAVRMHWQAKVQPNCQASQKINAAQLAGDPTETISGISHSGKTAGHHSQLLVFKNQWTGSVPNPVAKLKPLKDHQEAIPS